jgi:hypothetical protein
VGRQAQQQHSLLRCSEPTLGAAALTTHMQVYDKSKISAIKHRSVRREARIMRYLTDKR